MTTPHKTLTKKTNKTNKHDDASNEECLTIPVFGQQYSNTVQDNVAMHIDSDGEDDEIMSYDQITAMLGEDTSTSDHLVNLFDEERRVNASEWFTMTTYTRRVKAYRTNQIEWIRATCVALGLLDSTAFRAIYYFDKVCAVKMVNRKHLSIMAACCLNIAAKFNDKDKYTPTIEEVADACQYSVESLVGSELQIMRALEFKLKIVLPLDFIQYYVAQKRAIFADDELRNHDEIENITENKKVLGDVEKFAVFFLHIAMESYSFYQFKSSIIALAVLCAARRAMQIKPFNHSELGMVGDNEESKQVNACFDRLWSKYHFKFPANAKTYSRYQPKDKK